jgi:ribosomal 50S subunit-associated protein YjgA (DUF615 family)
MKIATYKYSADDEWDLYEEDLKDDDEEYISSSESKFLKEWQAIYKAAESNVALKKALERVKVTYHLSKQYGNSKT